MATTLKKRKTSDEAKRYGVRKIVGEIVSIENRRRENYNQIDWKRDAKHMTELAHAQVKNSKSEWVYKGGIPTKLYAMLQQSKPDGSTNIMANKDYMRYLSKQPQTEWLRKFPMLLQ